MLSGLKPEFWKHPGDGESPARHMFNYRRLWRSAVLATVGVAVIPLVIMTLVLLGTTERAVASEANQRTHRFASNARRTVTSFLKTRRDALEFLIRDNDPAALQDEDRLNALLRSLKASFGGFVDLGLIDSQGTQIAYVGPFPLQGAEYRDQPWFREVAERGLHVSEVFLGYRQAPHLVIAVKQSRSDGSFVVLRATIDTERFNHLLSELHLSEGGDAFIINRQGKLQTPSRYHGAVFDDVSLPVPEPSEATRVDELTGPDAHKSLVGHAHIPDSPFVLLVVSPEDALLAAWRTTRVEILAFVLTSVLIIVAVILAVATLLVNRIYSADERRLATLHKVEYQNKMASIGRLAAGVAHEINNPLAIINEKAGLLQDLMTLKAEYARDDKLLGIAAVIVSSVERCGAITRRLLGFARRSATVTMELLAIEDVVSDVLGFLGKEAEHKGISINVCMAEDVPQVRSDRGKLQEVFLNLINNALAAMPKGGALTVTAEPAEPDAVAVMVSDDGCGIAPEDLARVFEPFFTKRADQGGTGLGLSITQGLVQGLGGTIAVESAVGRGTTFTIRLPREGPAEDEEEEEEGA